MALRVLDWVGGVGEARGMMLHMDGRVGDPPNTYG